jgi:hypothetical protein
MKIELLKARVRDVRRNNVQLNGDKVALEKKYSDLFSEYSALIGLFNSGNTAGLRAKWVIVKPRALRASGFEYYLPNPNNNL